MISAVVIGFILAQLGLMLDMMMDYKNYFWRIRFGIFWRAASYSEKKFLAEEKRKADTYGEATITIDAAYWKLVERNWMLKRWVCTQCMVIYLSMYVLIPISILEIVAYGNWLFPFLAIATMYYFLKNGIDG